MKKELQNQQVLALYDVRGIQNYIFKSNAAKEIIGASVLVDKIITEGIKSYINARQNKDKYMVEWTQDNPREFLENPEIEMQIMFIGGGNAYVLFRHGNECQKVNRFLAKYLLERTYSLNLAVAVVPKTEDYSKDYESINNEMRRIKARMPLNMPVGAMPFMAADSITGYPLTSKEKDKYFSTEAKLKRMAFPRQEDEKIFDNMVTEKGDSSTLAVIHIDGNSMGNRIKNEMQKINGYGDAIEHMRKLSTEISGTFRNAVDQMKAYMDKLTPLVKENGTHKLYREIIVAGDDITFVCNAKIALPSVEYFMKFLGENSDFTACGGISFFNSHFPFSDAYQVAEACCENAKKRAKQKENRGDNDKIGNFLDYQICTNIRASKLDAYRDRHYRTEGKLFIARPYYISFAQDKYHMNEKNKKYQIDHLKYWMEYFHKMPRSKAKRFRDTISMGENEIREQIAFLNSRGYKEFAWSEEEVGIWYDALEIMDWFIEEEA